MYYMFDGATSFTGTGISNWDVSAVRDMVGLFHRASAFTGNVSSWDVSSALDMSLMFEQASSFAGDLSLWNTHKVQRMVQMFSQATSFTGSGVNNFNVGSVLIFARM